MYACTVDVHTCKTVAPHDVGMANITCAAMDLIIQCTVTWNVSVYIHVYI